MKKSTKTIAGVLIGLAATSVIGVGFSAWLINQTNTETVEQINVGVANVTDGSLMIYDAVLSSTNGTILFDAKAGDTTAPIIYDGSDGGEDLTFAIEYRVELGPNVTNTAGVTASLAFNSASTDGAKTAYNNAMAVSENKEDVIAPLTIGAAAVKILSVASSTTVANVEVTSGVNVLITSTYTTADASELENTGYTGYNVVTTFSYFWGRSFNGQNPSEYATNGMTAAQITEIVNKLTNLRAANGVKLDLALTTVLA